MNISLRICFTLLAIAGTSRLTSAGGISSLEIGTKTLACTDCLDWKLIGECNWLKCKAIYCSPRASPKVAHYIPDLAIAVYSSVMPITDLKKVKITPTKSAVLTEALYPGETLLDYKHVNVYGNPAILGYKALNTSGGWMCESTVKVPWMIYFESASDQQWQAPTFEQKITAQISFLNPTIKAQLPLGKWANIYPRCGWGIHPYDAINAAVAAHRAAEILTDTTKTSHVMVPIGRNCGEKCWPPGKVETGKISTHKFQPLYPIYETRGMVFGGDAAWANGRNRDSKESYVYALWRPYKCCKKEGQIFVGSIDW